MYVYVYSIFRYIHIFLIHSSVDGHLSCFHVLAIVRSDAMNIGMHVSLPISEENVGRTPCDVNHSNIFLDLSLNTKEIK